MTLLNEHPLKDKFCLSAKSPTHKKTFVKERTIKEADYHLNESTSA